MKILHIIDSLAAGGGAEESLVGMLPLLRERGIHGDVICLYERAGHQQALRNMGFRVDVLGEGPLVKKAIAIRRTVQQTRPDLVHSSLIDACLATRLAMLGLPTPQLNSLVNTTYDPVRISDLRIAPWKMSALRFVDAWTSRWVKPGFHALTEAVKAEAVDVLGIPPSKVWVIPRGRDSEAMGANTHERRRRVRTSLGISDEQIVILNVGRQEPQKAKGLLIEAFNQVAVTHPEAVLLIAGKEGRDSGRLRSAVTNSAASQQIRVLGHRSDIPDLLAAADLFVFPSHYEGLGGALVEALAMGCPSIGSDAPAVAEVLGHGEYGLVVPRGDAAALSNAMMTLVASKGAREELGRRGHARFREAFELHTVIDRMADLYHDMTLKNLTADR